MLKILGDIIITPNLFSGETQEEKMIHFPGGFYPNFLKNIYMQLDISYPKFYKMDGMARLGFLGAEFMLREKSHLEDCALLFINKHSTLSVDKAYQESLAEYPSPGLFVYTLPNIVQGEICIRHKIYGENYTFIDKEFTAECLFEKTEILFANEGINNALLACIDYVDDKNYKLCMVLVTNTTDNHCAEFNLTELENIIETMNSAV